MTYRQDGNPRRLADGRNAWKKMDQAQRETFLRDVVLTDMESIDLALSIIQVNPRLHKVERRLVRASREFSV